MATPSQKDSNQEKSLTLSDLASFTDEVLLPGMERIVEAYLGDVTSDIGGLKSDMTTLRKEMNSQFETVNDKLDDLKASANTLDDILEQHPIPRIERLEKHAHLPPYVRAFAEE